jgi:ABC-type glutathione transport system ATPase component
MDRIALLSIKHLSVTNLTQGRVLLDEVDLDIYAGERIAIIGTSGSGKTLLATTILDLKPSVDIISGM